MLVSDLARIVGPHRHHVGMRPPTVLFGSSTWNLGVQKEAQSKSAWMDKGFLLAGQRQNPIKLGSRTNEG